MLTSEPLAVQQEALISSKHVLKLLCWAFKKLLGVAPNNRGNTTHKFIDLYRPPDRWPYGMQSRWQYPSHPQLHSMRCYGLSLPELVDPVDCIPLCDAIPPELDCDSE